MRCASCDALLFDQPEPVCPSCSLPFIIEDYTFEQGTVSFNCPHCDQAYYGNDDRGLPVPRAFECPGCQQQIKLQQMRVKPLASDAAGQLSAHGTPWDRRKEIGLVTAWWDTVKMILMSPTAFFRDHIGTSFKEAYFFDVICHYVGMIPASAVTVLISWLTADFVRQAGKTPPELSAVIAMSGVVALVGPLVFPIVPGVIMPGITHLCLWPMAAKRRSFMHTYRTFLYGGAANVLAAVPLCGALAAPILTLVVWIKGMKEVHRTGVGVAILATLFGFLFFTAASIGLNYGLQVLFR